MIKQKMKSCGALLAGLLLTGLGLCGLTPAAQAAAGDISTIAGYGSNGFSGDGGQATAAQFYFPHAVAVDSAGNTYICDRGNKRVRKITPGGIISTFAGNGTENAGQLPGPATSIALANPISIVTDSSNNVYIADSNSVYKVDTTGTMTLFAGRGTRGDGGQAVGAALYTPYALAVDRMGNIYIAENEGYRVRKVAPNGIISTVAGTGQGGFSGDGGPATSAKLLPPQALAVDSVGNLYIAENARVRKVNTSGIISTYAGTGSVGYNGDNIPSNTAQLWAVNGLAVDSKDNLYISEEQNNRIRKVVNGLITTFAGTGRNGFSGDGQPASQAQLAAPRGICIDSSDNLFITDYGNTRIRKVDAKDDPSPTILTISDVTQTEGNSGTKNLTFTVSRIGNLNKVSSVDYATSDETAINNVTAFNDATGASIADYRATSGHLDFAVGETTKIVNVPIVGDVIYEPSETFKLTLLAPLGASLPTRNYAIGTISNDEEAPEIYDTLDWGIEPFSPMSGYVGSSIEIYGRNFTNVNAVSFNGVPSNSFTVDGEGQITAIVPAGATTGSVTVSAPGISATSVDEFTVLPRTSSVVNTLTDVVNPTDGLISLREAITAANNTDTIITFSSSAFSSPKTITLSSALPSLSGNVTIVGPAAGVTITGTDRSFPIFQVSDTSTAEFDGLTINGGSVGILNGGMARIKNCTFTANSTGVSNSASVTIQNCTFTGNTGFGISNSSSATIRNCTLSNNGGALTTSGDQQLTNVLFAANGATPFAGFTNPGSAGDANKNYSFATAAAAGLEVDSSGNAVLKDNGGPTKTIALKAGSPVLDKGAIVVSTDQRGTPRRGSSDIGAYELQQSPTLARIDAQRGPIGAFVIISGTSFANASSVRFNGTAAPFTVASPTRIIASVPSGATTGPVIVTTPEGTISSTGTLTPVFTVTPPQGIVAWGSNSNGQTTIPGGLNNVVAVASGEYHSVALKSDGTVVAWGDNDYGQSSVPSGLSGVVAISCGHLHTLALKSDGTVVAWGDNHFGQTSVPIGLGDVVAIAAGIDHNLALKSDGTVVAWGLNPDYQSNVPTYLADVVDIGAGKDFSSALKSDGTVVVWGSNFNGQRNIPDGLNNVVNIEAQGWHVLALKSNGSVVQWGSFGSSDVDPPGSTSSGVVAVSAGYYHSVALKNDGTVVNWGIANTGFFTGYNPIPPAGLSGVVAIGAGGFHDLAIVAPTPTLSVSNVSLLEGSGGTPQQMRFTVSVSAVSSSAITVNYATAAGTATAGSDFTGTSGTLTIPAGQNSGTISVPIIGDTTKEPDETFSLNLTSPTGATFAGAVTTLSATGTILNDDATPSVSMNGVNQAEGNSGSTSFNFVVRLSVPSSVDASFNYATSNGTATAGSDYTATNGTLTIPAGSTTGTISVPMSGDTAVEGDETFTLTLLNAANAVFPNGATTLAATGTIVNDDNNTVPAATDVTSQFTIYRSSLTRNRSTGRWVLAMVIQNSGATIDEPMYLAFDNLSSGVSLYNPNGSTSRTSPAGSSYRTLALPGVSGTKPNGIFASGSALNLNVEFVNPGNATINFTPRLLQGPGTP